MASCESAAMHFLPIGLDSSLGQTHTEQTARCMTATCLIHIHSQLVVKGAPPGLPGSAAPPAAPPVRCRQQA